MSLPRLGSARVTISFSDKEGFSVAHDNGTVLRKIEPDHLERADWDILWRAINEIEIKAARRQNQHLCEEKQVKKS